MPKTKRRFADDDPPSDSSSEEEEVPARYHVQPGGGKQLSRMRPGGGGKQLRMMAQPESEEKSDSESESEEDAPKQTVVYRSGGKQFGGKQFRPSGGKQLRMPQESDDSDDDEEEDEAPAAPAPAPAPVYRPSGGKSLARMQRGGGKQLRMPAAEEDESESEDSDEEEEEQQPARVIQRARYGGGKQLRPPAPKKDESEDSDENKDEDMDIDEDSAEEMDEEEASAPPPPPPKQEDDMEESSDEKDSSSESEEERELDMETFDTSELVQGEEDQKYLDSLPEFEREAIIAERFEKVKNAADMKRALRENKRREREQKKMAKAQKEKASSKKKAPPKAKAPKTKKKKKEDTSGDAAIAAALSSTRESARNRDASGSKGKKAAALKAIREERSSKVLEKKEESESDLDYGDEGDEDSDDDYEDENVVNKPWLQKNRKTRLQRDASSEESSDEDEAEERTGRPSTDDKANFIEADVEDYLKVTIPRRRLARWCHEPYFEKAVTNCYVRLAIGRDKKSQKACYRLCKIVGVDTKPAEYKFPAIGDAKPISTNKVLKLKFGNNVNKFCMYMVSDSRPSEDDVRHLVNQQKNVRLNDEILSKKRAAKLKKIQDELLHNYTYTKEDIEKSIAAKKKQKISNIAMEKTRISIAVQASKLAVKDAEEQVDQAKKALLEAGNDEEVEELERTVNLATETLDDAKADLEAKLEEQKRILAAEESRKKKIKGSKKVQNWNLVNERAKNKNKTADFESYKQQRELEKKEEAAQGAPKFNPYARRKVKPKILWEVGQKKEEEAAEEREQSQAMPDGDQVEEAIKQPSANGRDDAIEASGGKDAKDEELVGNQKVALDGEGHDFAIDDELLARGSGISSSLATMDGRNGPRCAVRVRKGLSLAEYQEKKAAGAL